MKAMLRSLKRKIIPVRGLGFPGDGKQRQRSLQIAEMQKLGLNKFFIDNYPELLLSNEAYISVADKLDVAKDLSVYFEKLNGWMNYPVQIQDLAGWVDAKGHKWPNIHPAHQHVVDAYKTYRPASVCEVGAGAGVVAKYVYAASEQKVRLACVEGSKIHLEEMRLNFSGESEVIPPNIKVPAEIIQGAAQKLPFADNSFEMLYNLYADDAHPVRRRGSGGRGICSRQLQIRFARGRLPYRWHC